MAAVMRAAPGRASSGGVSQIVCRRGAVPPMLAMYWSRHPAMPGPVIRCRLCGQAPLSRLQTSRRSAKYSAGAAGWPTLMTAAGSPGRSSWSSRSCRASRSSVAGESSPARAGASSLARQGRACRPAACGCRAARHSAGCRPRSRARGISQAGAPGAADMAGCRQEGHRCSSSRRCAGQVNTTGSRHAFCQAPPCCCWMRLLSPARHCGQYRVAEVNTHGLASDRGPHWSAVTRGAVHGYRPDMLLMHSSAVSVAVSLVMRAKVPAGASSRCSIRLRRAGWRLSRPGGEAGELHDAGRGEPEPVREPEQVAGQGLIRQRVQAAGKRAQLAHRLSSRVMVRPWSRSPGRGHRRRCCARACISRLRCRRTRPGRAGWRESRQPRRRDRRRRGG